MRLEISQLYDSHVHWLGTGLIETGLKLFAMTCEEDISKYEIKPEYFRDDWLVGFGWNQSRWPDEKMPSKQTLDRVFPDFPVMFQRADGHTSWLNSKALAKLGYGAEHAGILREEEHFKAYSSLPKYSDLQIRAALKKAMNLFNREGFTHIRDMTCDEQQWQQAIAMDQAGELTMYVQENFLCEEPRDLDRILDIAEIAKAQQTKHVQAQGIKIFYDGTLGSDTAYLSQCACSPKKFAWSFEDIETLIRKSWKRGFEVAVHTIGDEAAHQVVRIAREVMATNQLTGWLNLEHVEVLRPETIQMMKALHVRCHMQPCHWLADREWIVDKLGDLYKHAFPWGTLSRSGIPLHFGSDSPVAKISFWDNDRALRESVRAKIPALKGDILDYHRFPGTNPLKNLAVFEGQVLSELFFDGRSIYPSRDS
ncbi:MAG: amidohydrolase family protein [Bdellovibrionaceae bacterium]|nr:amidohydrolase family protein [Pseudobdellovibrionaceae bacterium]